MSAKPRALDVHYLVREYRAGKTLQQLADETEVGANTIRRRLVTAGVELRTRSAAFENFWKTRDPDLSTFFHRYVEGEGYVLLAREAGIGPRRFLKLMSEAGIPQREMTDVVALRYARMSKSEREALVANAHATKRGRPASPRALERRAQTMEKTLQLASRADLLLAVWLAQRGVSFTLQKACGPYSIDIAVHEPPVAVEVNGFGHAPPLRQLSRSRSTPTERRMYLLDRGWRLIEIDISEPTSERLSTCCADRVVALLDAARKNKPSWGKHCVILGNGELAP